MNDQAEKLRKLMTNTVSDSDNSIDRKIISYEKMAKILAISSGKGGVGKTNFAINFSITLKRLGYEVAVIDADIGLSNIEILAGVHIKYSISDIIFNNKSIFDIMEDGPEGIKIISGGAGFKEFRLFEQENFHILIEEIEKLQSIVDFIIIDTGAGISKTVIDFIMTTEEVMLICTPDPTSIMDSYTLVKAILNNGFKGKINLISNLVESRKEGNEIFNKLYKTINNFLKFEISYLGYIEKNKIVNTAVRNQIPFVISNPKDQTSKRISAIAMNYIDGTSSTKDIKTSFAKKLLDVFSRRDG